MPFQIRDTRPEDAAAVRAVYAHYVSQTAVTFETDVPSVEEMSRRIALAQERHDHLVLEDADGIHGYA